MCARGGARGRPPWRSRPARRRPRCRRAGSPISAAGPNSSTRTPCAAAWSGARGDLGGSEVGAVGVDGDDRHGRARGRRSISCGANRPSLSRRAGIRRLRLVVARLSRAGGPAGWTAQWSWSWWSCAGCDDLAPGYVPHIGQTRCGRRGCGTCGHALYTRRGDLVLRAALRGPAVRLLLLGDGHGSRKGSASRPPARCRAVPRRRGRPAAALPRVASAAACPRAASAGACPSRPP